MTFESDGNERLLFGVDDGDCIGGDDDDDYNPFSFIVLADADGRERVHVRVHADGRLDACSTSIEGEEAAEPRD